MMTKKIPDRIISFLLCSCFCAFALGESGFIGLSEAWALSSNISVSVDNVSDVYYVPLCDKYGNELCQLQMGGEFTRSYYADGITYQLTTNGITVEVSKETNLVTKISVSDGSYFHAVAFDETTDYVDVLGDICGVPMYRIVDSLFADCSGITEVAIRYNVKYIGKRAFENCINMKAITMPNSITEIGGSAFIGCKSLESVKLPKSITSLPGDGNYGFFEECISLSSVTIPDSVTEIGYAAFYRCNSLQRIVVPDSVTFIDEWAFSECEKLSFVQLPKELTKLSIGVFAKDVALQEVILPNKLQEIENAAFRGCTALESIEFPESLSVISGTDTFSDCSSLSKLNIPSNLTEFSFLAFDGCSGIKDVTVEAGHPTLISINGAVLNKEQDTLIYCPRGKTSYTVPTSVKIIQQRIRSSNMANGTETLLAGAFSNCNMQTLKLPDVKGVIEYGAFENSYIKTLEINGEWTCEKTSFKEAEIETLHVNAKLRFEDDASSAFREVVYFKPPAPFYQDFQNNSVFFTATRRTVQMSDVALSTFGNFIGYNNGGRSLDCLQEIWTCQ